MRLGPCDAHIGWSARARGAHLAEVVSNDRFLLLPGVEVPHLASHPAGPAGAAGAPRVAAAARRRAAAGLETCGRAGGGPGTSYAAAGWERVGQTQGRPPGGAQRPPKAVWLRGLAADWRARLRQEPPRPLGACPPLELVPDADGAEHEFGRSDLPDGRLRRRLGALGAAWDRSRGQPVSAICHQVARAAGRLPLPEQCAGAPRGHPAAAPRGAGRALRAARGGAAGAGHDLPQLHRLARCGGGLGAAAGTRTAPPPGLFVHAAVAFTEGGRPLGVSGLESWARPWSAPEAEPAGDGEAAAGCAAWSRGWSWPPPARRRG